MRIYNGKDSQLDLPLSNGERISIGPKSISKDFLPSTDFLSMVVSTFDYDEIALVVSGVIEVNLCSSVQCCNGFVAYSVAEAVERFSGEKKSTAKNKANFTEENRKKADEEIKEFQKNEEKKKEEK